MPKKMLRIIAASKRELFFIYNDFNGLQIILQPIFGFFTQNPQQIPSRGDK